MSSTGSFREKGMAMKVKWVDFGDFPDTGPDSLTGFFREIGALNAAFSKRFYHLIGLHSSTPLGETMEEYIRFQQNLEDKYGVKLHARIPRVARDDVNDDGDAEAAHANTPPTSDKNFARLEHSKFNRGEAASPKSTGSEDSESPRAKRKAENFEEPTLPSRTIQAKRDVVDKPAQLDKLKDAVPDSGYTSRNSQTAAVPSGFFNMNAPKPTDLASTERTSEAPKKSLFAGFGLNPDTNKAPASSSFNSSAGVNFSSLFGPTSSGTLFTGSTGTDTTPKAPSTTSFPSFVLREGSSLFGTGEPKSDSTTAKTSTESTSSKPATFPSFFNSSGSPGAAAPVTLGGFSFGNMAAVKLASVKPVSGDGDENDDDDGEVDPIPIVPAEEQDVAEVDAIASNKCYVYYLDNGAYIKRGVGMAHIKRIDDTMDAVQLLIRASTSLGAILLNTRITKDMKTTRLSQPQNGKTVESVQLACHAAPNFKNVDPKKPYPFTLKFKDAKDADEIYRAIVDNVKK